MPSGSKLEFFSRIWKFSGEGIYMGDEIGSWFSRYLGDEGCSVYYMSPSHKPRYLMDDPVWTDLTQPGDQVSLNLIKRG